MMGTRTEGERKVVIFCSASYDIEPKFNQAAREVVRAACSLGYTIVSGGAVKGTMGVVADETAACGGFHVGVLPRFMSVYHHPALNETIWTDTMSARKEKMREGTCAAIALPGGIGTLDELVETLTLAKLDIYKGRVIAFNLDGFFDPFIALLDHYVRTGMLDPGSRDLVSFPSSVAELTELLKQPVK